MIQLMEEKIDEVKEKMDPNKPVLEITVPFPTASSTRYVNWTVVEKISRVANRLKLYYGEKYNVVVLPYDISINGPNVVQLHLSPDVNLDEMISFLDQKCEELGGMSNDPS